MHDPTRWFVAAAVATGLCAGCGSAPEQQADADYQAPKIYRTGSNIPTKDYGASDVKVVDPKAYEQARRAVPEAPIPKGM